MRRSPQQPAPPVPTSEKGRAWRRYRVRLVTPLYGGGTRAGEPDREMPVRAAAIRGQLRAWWRLLHGGEPPDGVALFRSERGLWGAMGDAGEERSSRVRLRVCDLEWDPETAIRPAAEYVRRPDGTFPVLPRFLHGIPDYALFPARGRRAAGTVAIEEEPHKVILPGLAFTLEVRCDDEARWGEVEQALRWWASFGGLGARTRRGLGSVDVAGLEPVTAGEVRKVGGRLELRLRDAGDDPRKAWRDAVDRLARFRQGVGIGRNPGADPKRPGRSRWPEADSIREITHRHAAKHVPSHPARIAFPRAAFGLPIVFHFKDKGDPPDVILKPQDAERMASPLILRACRLENGRWAPGALLLPERAWSCLTGLELTGEGAHLPHPLPEAAWRPPRAEARERASKIPPMVGEDGQVRGDDALEAFLTFFAEG